MREKILNTASDLFLNYGFKSVTMDEIADKMGISKKTIYASFPTKAKLVEATVHHLFEVVKEGIKKIQNKEKNPLKELYEIRRYGLNYINSQKASPHYQLNKYYPKIAKSVEGKYFNTVLHCVIANLERGITTGHYRPGIPISFIARIHFAGIKGVKDPDLFPPEEYSNEVLMDYFLDYHLRAICTPKGLQTLEEFKNSHENFI
ncbi:TetR/AcrR family transcriptional regulator [Zunongwangia sp. F363]|uniref:TetR/AcrR family transcriptional regulator n=1 Tax=Autumnicola tepida TaxID=3075595 RepID=A0ABU3CCT2_9FLAO|nr:TetR/AcrR family transcriptional regulator [Zunongwangia sp. F363]MDT0644139.1 TetR/AcrR family transcriptional regulator [Zunongwangia sp. F363]